MLGMVLGTQALQSPRCAGCLVGLCRGFPPSSFNFPLVRERKGFLPPENILPGWLEGEGSMLQEGNQAQCSSCMEQAEGRFGAAWGGCSPLFLCLRQQLISEFCCFTAL